MWVVVTVVVVVMFVATYLTWTATRVDRLHARAAAAFSALDAQSIRRAAAAAEAAERHDLDGVRKAARAVLGARPDDRQAAENDLTKALRAAAVTHGTQTLADVDEVNRLLALARQVHTDLVRDALAVRRRPVVRLLRLSRRHPQPDFFDINEPTLNEGQEPSTR
jgi:hypothetical protein